MIRHANLKLPLPVGALTVAMVQPSFTTLLMTAIGRPVLLPSCFLAAPIRTVPLPPVTAAANPKQHTASFRAAVPLPQYPAIGFVHLPRRRTGQMPLRGDKLTSPVLGVMVLLRFCERVPETKTPIALTIGVFLFRLVSTLPEPRQSLGDDVDQFTGARSKKRVFRCALTQRQGAARVVLPKPLTSRVVG